MTHTITQLITMLEGKTLKLIEQWGSGVPRMFREADALGLPEPEIIEIGMRVRWIIRSLRG